MTGMEVHRSTALARAALTGAAVLLAVLVTTHARAATAPTPPDCGAAIAKPTGGTWQCTFADEFSGTSLDTGKWVAQQTESTGYTSGLTACFENNPNNVSVSNGTLKLTARREAAPFMCKDPYGWFPTQYTSGMVSTANLFSQAYGRFEVRAKLSPAAVRGLQTSLWLWPLKSNRYGAYPGSGEIDFAEMFSNYADRAVPYIHYNPAGYDPNVTNYNCLITDLSAFHTYAVEWTTSYIKIIYDGRTCLTDYWNPAWPLSKPQPFDQPFIIALTQALGQGTNAFDPIRTPLPATTEIDYVHAWK
jgi:beta-glucanase (GH16 family)